jgi:glycosidase
MARVRNEALGVIRASLSPRLGAWASALLLLGVLGGCAAESGEPTPLEEEDPFRACLDAEGRVDCDRPGCATHPFCGGGGGGGADAGHDAVSPDAEVPRDVSEPDMRDVTPQDVGAETTPGADGADDADDVTPLDDAQADGDAADGTPPVDATDDGGGTVDPPRCAAPTLAATAAAATSQRTCASVIRLPAGATAASTVRVIGQWSDFEMERAESLVRDAEGAWSVTLDLPAGEYGYRFVFDGSVETSIPPDVPSRWNGAFENRNLIVRDCAVPDARVLEARSNACGVSAAVQLQRAADGAAFETVEVTVGGRPVDAAFDATTGVVQVRAGDLPPGKHSVRIRATDVAGRGLEDGLVFLPLWVEAERWVWQDGLMYLIFVDRFRNSEHDVADPVGVPVPGVPMISNYMGGDFRGILDAMREDWFEQLAVDILWLSPIQQNPDGAWISADRQNQFTGFHGYWPTHPRELQERYGDREADAETRFRELMTESHERGIRVLADVVLNHVHEDHTYLRDFPEWFTAAPCVCTSSPGACNWDTNPIGCWFMEYLPDLDFRNHAIVEQVVEDVLWWITEFDIDGFRLDAAKHMEHVILRRLRYEIDRRFQHGDTLHFYLVGETYTGEDGHGLIMDYVAPFELDGQFDFPLLYPILRVFADGASFRDLAARVQLGRTLYGDAVPWMSPFFGNHDIPRFASRVSNPSAGAWDGFPDPMKAGLGDTQWNIINRASFAAVFTLTQEGIPLLYYGDELGLAGGPDPDNRRMMDFEPFLSDSQREMLGRMRQIGQARRAHPALRRGGWQELWVDDGLYMYARVTRPGEVAIVAMNRGGRRDQSVPIPASLGIDGATLVDLLGSPRTLRVEGGAATIGLNDWEYVVWGTR